MNNSGQLFWKRCSSCKKEIPFGALYYRCSVSTCQHERTGYRFCSVGCWDAHLGSARHREAYAEEVNAPTAEEASSKVDELASRPHVKKVVSTVPVNSVAPTTSSAGATSQPSVNIPTTDTLVVVSKVKALIKEQCGFNTSECCIGALTKKIVVECLRGIDHAKSAGRKTVMGRDIY